MFIFSSSLIMQENRFAILAIRVYNANSLVGFGQLFSHQVSWWPISRDWPRSYYSVVHAPCLHLSIQSFVTPDSSFLP